MNNKTPIIIPKPFFSLSLADTIFAAGSCFSEELAKYFRKGGIHIVSNPFGTIYNAHSLYMMFERLFSSRVYTGSELCLENSIYFSLEHSTYFDRDDINDALIAINGNMREYSEKLKQCNVFMITLGTSVVYEYIKKGLITANCHRLPDHLFRKRILGVEENTNYIRKIIDLVINNIPDAKIIFSLSPVRHTPRDLIENSYSKSILRTCLGNLGTPRSFGSRDGSENVYYFPAYEIVMDELRSYDNYKKDMIHIKCSAVDHIMNRFAGIFFKDDITLFMADYVKYNKMSGHKIKNPGSNKYFELLKSSLKTLNDLNEKKSSRIIHKEFYHVCRKLLKYFYKEKSLEDILLSELSHNEELKVIMINALHIKNGTMGVLDEKGFLKNNSGSKMKKFKLKLLMEYYRNRNDHANLLRILDMLDK